MIDFKKRIVNSDKFRQSAIRKMNTGEYCSYPKGTTEYFAFWRTEQDRCINGWYADDGDFISGYNYFYLNYCPIVRVVWEEREQPDGTIRLVKDRRPAFPDFYDYDYYFFMAVEEAERKGKHLCVTKARRKGYSYKLGSMMCRNFFLIANSKSYAYAANKQYLTEDGILTKSWDYMDYIDEHTAWGKKRQAANTSMRRRASFFVTDEFGNKVEAGYKSEILGVSMKDNPDVVRGKAGKLIVFEESGSNPHLQAAWQIARPSVEQDGVAFGLMIMFGTGGDQGDNIMGLKDAFYNPDKYNCLGFENIWDDGITDKSCGFFVPDFTNLDIRDADGARMCMDKDGNTLTEKAREYVLGLRAKELAGSSDSRMIDRYVAEHPITPSESFLEFNGNIFPKKELQNQLARLRTITSLRNSKQVGELILTGKNTLRWEIKQVGDITNYPLGNDQDATGAIVIWEHPPKNIPDGMYIIGVDPYDHDQSGTNSLGSTFVYKRGVDFEENADTIVAEYTGRPRTAEDYYENVRKLALYYNATIMYENERKGLFPYFTQKHSDYLLADQPTILKDVVKNSKVQRGKGCHMSREIKLWGEGLIKEWLTEEVNGTPRLNNIYSEPLLEELISYNDRGNFDRVMALMQVMIYREQLYHHRVQVRQEEIKSNMLFDSPLFGKNWFTQSENTAQTYTTDTAEGGYFAGRTFLNF